MAYVPVKERPFTPRQIVINARYWPQKFYVLAKEFPDDYEEIVDSIAGELKNHLMSFQEAASMLPGRGAQPMNNPCFWKVWIDPTDGRVYMAWVCVDEMGNEYMSEIMCDEPGGAASRPASPNHEMASQSDAPVPPKFFDKTSHGPGNASPGPHGG